MEVFLFIIAGTALALALLWFSARNTITVCVASVVDGKLTLTRGAIAPRVLGDLRDVVREPRVKSATIRVLRAKDRARVEARGDLTDAQMQQLRNVIGTVPLAQLTNVAKKKKQPRR